MSDCSEDDEVFMLASQQYEASINDLDAVQCQLPHAKPVTDGHNIDHRSSDADEDEEYVRQYLTDREFYEHMNEDDFTNTSQTTHCAELVLRGYTKVELMSKRSWLSQVIEARMEYEHIKKYSAIRKKN